MAKIGLLGGTFDPPHYGHLLVAQEALSQCSLDEVWFIPSAVPPHKLHKKITPDKIRIEMVKLAIGNEPGFSISLIEFERTGRSYTYDTITEIKKKYPHDHFFFIIGADMINDLPNWYKIEELIDLITFIGVQRPGYVIQSPYQNEIIKIEIPQLEISSSMLRERFKIKENTKYLLPDEVRVYIEVNKIYG